MSWSRCARRSRHFVSTGACAQVLLLRNGDSQVATPRGVYGPTVRRLLLYLGILSAFIAAGVSHLFDNLAESPHRTLFMASSYSGSARR